jgi:Flp pilus assembly protein TadB
VRDNRTVLRLVAVLAALIAIGVLLAVFWGIEAAAPFAFIAILGLGVVAMQRAGENVLRDAGRANYERLMRPKRRKR